MEAVFDVAADLEELKDIDESNVLVMVDERETIADILNVAVATSEALDTNDSCGVDVVAVVADREAFSEAVGYDDSELATVTDGGTLGEKIGLVADIVAVGSADGDNDAVPDIEAIDDALEERENPDIVAFDERETNAVSERCGLCVTKPLLAVTAEDGDNELLTDTVGVDEKDSAGVDELELVPLVVVSGEPVTDTEAVEDGDDVGRLLLGERDILALFETLEERDAVAQ